MAHLAVGAERGGRFGVNNPSTELLPTRRPALLQLDRGERYGLGVSCAHELFSDGAAALQTSRRRDE